MRKLKKIRIIEDGRICSPEEMNEIRGGVTCQSGYLHCVSGIAVVSCAPTAHSGYESDSTGVFCGSTHVYNQCGWGAESYDTCSAGTTYHFT